MRATYSHAFAFTFMHPWDTMCATCLWWFYVTYVCSLPYSMLIWLMLLVWCTSNLILWQTSSFCSTSGTYSISLVYMLWTRFAWTCSDPFALIVSCPCKPSVWKHQILTLCTYSRLCCHRSPKGGDWKHLGPNLILAINDDTIIVTDMFFADN